MRLSHRHTVKSGTSTHWGVFINDRDILFGGIQREWRMFEGGVSIYRERRTDGWKLWKWTEWSDWAQIREWNYG